MLNWGCFRQFNGCACELLPCLSTSMPYGCPLILPLTPQDSHLLKADLRWRLSSRHIGTFYGAIFHFLLFSTLKGIVYHWFLFIRARAPGHFILCKGHPMRKL